MRNKILSLIFIFYILVSFSAKVFCLEKAEVSILSNKDYLNIGEEVEITVFIENAKLVAYNFELSFDSEKLELVYKEENSNVKENRILTLWYEIEGGKKAKINEIEKYVFRAKKEGNVDFKVEGEFYNSTGELLETEYKSKEIQISNLESEEIENELKQNTNDDSLNQNIDNEENILNETVDEENNLEEKINVEINENREASISNTEKITNNIVENEDLKNKNIIINEINPSESYVLEENNISQEENLENNIQKNNANLETLRIDREGLIPEFKPEIYKYYLTVPKEIENLEIEVVPQNKNASIEISGNNQLVDGLNIIKIKVISEDKSKVNVYELQVTKTVDLESANTNLQTLAIENAMLNPSFDNNITSYSVEVANSVENLRLLAIPENENASVEISGDTNLKEGRNELKIVVTAQNKFTKKEILIDVYRRNEVEEEEYEKRQEDNAQKIEEAYNIGNNYKINEMASTEEIDKSLNKQSNRNFLYMAIVVLMVILSGVLGIIVYKIYLKK